MTDDARVPPPEFLEELERVVLPLIVVDGSGRWHPIGTAFVIGRIDAKRGLLVTAVHNLRKAIDIDQPRPRHHPSALAAFLPDEPPDLNLSRTRIFVGTGLATRMELAELRRAWYSPALDVALMAADLPADSEATFTYRLALDSRPVTPGLPVFAAGYPDMTAGFTEAPNYETQA